MIVAAGEEDPDSILTVCAHGFGKRTLLTEYRAQNRGGKGLIDIQTSERNGPVVAVAKVTDLDEVMLTTSSGMVIRTKIDEIRPIGRNTQGVRLIRVEDGDAVSSLAKLPREEIAEVEAEAVALRPADGAIPPAGALPAAGGDGKAHGPHIIDDGVAGAEASDHLDDEQDGGAE
jgi:DNA gyrase subunit A